MAASQQTNSFTGQAYLDDKQALSTIDYLFSTSMRSIHVYINI